MLCVDMSLIRECNKQHSSIPGVSTSFHVMQGLDGALWGSVFLLSWLIFPSWWWREVQWFTNYGIMLPFSWIPGERGADCRLVYHGIDTAAPQLRLGMYTSTSTSTSHLLPPPTPLCSFCITGCHEPTMRPPSLLTYLNLKLKGAIARSKSTLSHSVISP